MIRLLALRKLLETTTAEEATMLCSGCTSYVDLCKILPWIYPKEDWRDLIQAQLLSGIKPRYINDRLEEYLTPVQISRIRKHPLMPEAEYVRGELDTELCITIAKEFYYKVLKPLQFKEYIDPPNAFTKWWLIKSKVRDSMLPIIFIHKKPIVEMFKVMSSHPAGRIGEFLNEVPHSATVCHMLGIAPTNARNYTSYKDDRGKEAASQYVEELDYVWNFLYKIRTIGIINDALMEAKYETFFRE